MTEKRLKHMAAVANYMYIHASEYILDKDEMFLTGFLHDIGYLNGEKDNHEKYGAKILEETLGVTNPHTLWCIENHSKIINNFSWSIDRHRKAFLLAKADMSIDAEGFLVGYDKRLEDISSRYGKDSETYIDCKSLINWLKEMEKTEEHKEVNYVSGKTSRAN